MRGAHRSSANRIKFRITCLIISLQASFTQLCVREIFLSVPTFLSSFLHSPVSASSKREARELRYKTGSVFRKASWPNLVLASVEQMSRDIMQSKKISPDIAKFARYWRMPRCPRDCDTRDNYIAQGMPSDSKRRAHDWFRHRSVFTMTGNVTTRIFRTLVKEK